MCYPLSLHTPYSTFLPIYLDIPTFVRSETGQPKCEMRVHNQKKYKYIPRLAIRIRFGWRAIVFTCFVRALIPFKWFPQQIWALHVIKWKWIWPTQEVYTHRFPCLYFCGVPLVWLFRGPLSREKYQRNKSLKDQNELNFWKAKDWLIAVFRTRNGMFAGYL